MRKREMLRRTGALLTAGTLLLSMSAVSPVYASGTDMGNGADAASAEGAADTVPPVIRDVEFAQNNATLRPGDTVTMKIYAYDEDSAVERAYATVIMSGGGDEFQLNPSQTEYNEAEQSFTLEWVIPEDTHHTAGAVYELGVSDETGNIAEWKTLDEAGQPIYQYKIEGESAADNRFEAQDFTFGNGQSVLQGETLQFSFRLVKLDETAEYPELVKMYFRMEGEETGGTAYYAQHQGDGVYTYEMQVYENTAVGKRVLAEILSESSGEEIALDGKEDVWFEIVEAELDHEKPVITSLTLDKNTGTVTAGEKVHIELTAADNVALDTSYASVNFESAVSLDMGKGLKMVSLTYDEAKEAFVGDFVVDEETYPCEWYCSDIHVYDEAGNRASRTDFDPDFDMTFPYYFYVADENGTASVVYEQVRIYAETVDEQGNTDSGLVATYENVERRTTLKELGFQFPETAEYYDGKVFAGWEIDNIYKPTVDENWQIVDDPVHGTANYDLRISPVYVEGEGPVIKAGDVNGDGKVDISDLRLTLRTVCGKVELTADQRKAADVEADGTVDIKDLRKILRYVCKKITEL